MKRLSLPALALVAAFASMSAQADILTASFSGTVASQTATSFSVGAAIAGSFVFDTGSASFLSFSVGGQSVAAGYTSSASMTPDMYSAIYQAQVSPVPTGGDVNSTFTVDLEGMNGWPAGGAVALLTNGAALAANLDPVYSTFGFYMANANGTDVHALSATLTGLQVTAVPEPASAALLLAGVFALGLRRLRGTQR